LPKSSGSGIITLMLTRLKAKAQKLEWLQFLGHDRVPGFTLDITPEELQVELAKIPAPLFLGRYTEDEIRVKLERNNILPELRRMGFEPVILKVETDGLVEHRILVHTGEVSYNKVILELRLREGVFKVRETISQIHPELQSILRSDTFPMLWIDWLLLQNPRAQFSAERPSLPDQKYPGLGLLNLVVPLIGEFAQETHKQAVLDIPEHFHGALFYSKWMKFFNPEMQGKMQAILRDLAGYPVALLSWAIRVGGLLNISGNVYEDWKPGEQIYPLSQELEDYFNSAIYSELMQRAFEENHYQLDLLRVKSRARFLEPEERSSLEAILQTWDKDNSSVKSY